MIETERLFLREMNENDVDSLFKVLGDPNIMQHYPDAFDEAKVRKWIENNMDRAGCSPEDTAEYLASCEKEMTAYIDEIFAAETSE